MMNRPAAGVVLCLWLLSPAEAAPAKVPQDSADEEGLPEGDDAIPAAVGVVADPRAASAAQRLLAEARRELAAVRSTHYSHHTHIDERAGVFEYDCSGFLSYALSIAAPPALQALLPLVTKRRPQAKTFVALLAPMAASAKGGAWQRVPRVADLGAGDVIAWLKAPQQKSRNTGHVMIVAAPPRQRGLEEWVVPIIDSSGGHRGADPRHSPELSGLGQGTIVLVTAAGAPQAFRWSERPQSPVLATTIVLGRVR